MPLTRRLILQKARHHPTSEALTDCKHTVSGTISLPSRGTFHHSLTVLSAIGHNKYSGLPGGPGRFTADSTSPLLLGKNNHTHQLIFAYRTITFYGRRFHTTSTNQLTMCQCPAEHTRCNPTTTYMQPLPGITHISFSHHPRSLATTNGITIVFFSYGY